MSRACLLASLTAAALLAAPAHASEYLSGSIGWFDVTQQDDEATQFGIEYRFNPWQYGIRPMLGFSVTTEGSTYGYGGLSWDIPLIDNQLYVIPNFAAGGYGRGNGKDLGYGLEFRSGIEMDYQFPNAQRVGIAFNHTSNASLGDHNPGVEVLLINYSLPMNLFGR